MLKKIISLIFIATFLGSFLLITSPNLVLANDDYGLNATAGEVSAFKSQINNSALTDNFLQTKTGQIIGVVLSFVGVLFLILIIYAGLLWMTAQGNEQKITKAKDLLVNAVIGLIIVFAAYAITAFVGDFVTNQMLK